MKARSSFAWSNRADIAPPLTLDRGHHCLYSKDVERLAINLLKALMGDHSFEFACDVR